MKSENTPIIWTIRTGEATQPPPTHPCSALHRVLSRTLESVSDAALTCRVAHLHSIDQDFGRTCVVSVSNALKKSFGGDGVMVANDVTNYNIIAWKEQKKKGEQYMRKEHHRRALPDVAVNCGIELFRRYAGIVRLPARERVRIQWHRISPHNFWHVSAHYEEFTRK